jgi:hypothetical protein
MGKAKDGSECYTRTNKEGGKYVTCEGSQQKREKRRKLKADGEPPVMTKKPKKPVASDSTRAKARRAGKAKQLTTRPKGRIDTDAPRNVGIVDKSKPKEKLKEKPKEVPKEVPKGSPLDAMTDWQRKAISNYKIKIDDSFNAEAIKKYNTLNKIPNVNGKKYIVYEGGAGQLKSLAGKYLSPKEERERYIKGAGAFAQGKFITFNNISQLENLVKERMSKIKGTLDSGQERKFSDYKPLSAGQLKRLSSATADKGIIITVNTSGGVYGGAFRPGFSFAYVLPYGLQRRPNMGDNLEKYGEGFQEIARLIEDKDLPKLPTNIQYGLKK